MNKTLTPMPELEKKAAAKLPDSPWKEMLVWISGLHDRAIHQPNNIFDDIWVEIGPGYTYAAMKIHTPSFGHWDLVQTAMDALHYAPEYAKLQLTHYLNTLYPDGQMPGTLSSKVRAGSTEFDPAEINNLTLPKTPFYYSHPPLWQEFVSDYYDLTGDREFLAFAFEKGKLNYSWWKRERSAPEGGFYYIDIVKRWWESGVDDGVRWDDVDGQAHSCIDASCHLYSVASHLAKWAEILGEDPTEFRADAEKTKEFINTELWDGETGFYYDIRPCRGELKKVMTYEGLWPLAFGIATKEQQEKLLKHLFDPKKFFSIHPIPTVALDEEKFSYNYWRGPAWTGPAFWLLRGMNRHGMSKEAQIIGKRVLDGIKYHFEKDHTVYEYYPCKDFAVDNLSRRKGSSPKGPCPDYLGHNPINALYWELFGTAR